MVPFLSGIPEIRIVKPRPDNPVNADGDFVLYWMTMQRRPYFNYALQRAVEWAAHLNKPLLIFEALRCDYRWASDRLHRFMLQGMLDHRDYFSAHGATYYPFVESTPGQGKGLLHTLGRRACVVVGDEFPCYFLPRMMAAAATQIEVAFEMIDGNGLLPLRAAPKAFERAVDFRRFLQKNLSEHLHSRPAPRPLKSGKASPLEKLVDSQVLRRWPASFLPEDLAGLPIDHQVGPVDYRGGFVSAQAELGDFLGERLSRYGERSQPGSHVASGLSPYLHFGHISVFQVLDQLARQENWNPTRMKIKANGSKEGTWGMSEAAESFLDELVTWRELGYVFAHYRADYDRYDSLPGWARQTLEEHACDRRDSVYTLEQFEQAETHDPVWNAAQRQLLKEGRIHNYMRMLWGKKVLEWTAHPRQALEILIELNNKYAVDGRNPNSYSGIFWCLGRFDRAWFERPIFGKIRYMSSDSTRRKFKLDTYLERWSGASR